jgi:uncharacterized protein (UPF0276 family)
MKLIKDIISKPSEALQAMVDGLLEQAQRKDFKIDMLTFGYYTNKLCYGCTATCTVQKLLNKNLTEENINSDYHSEFYGIENIREFENVIDSARAGFLKSLFNYFNLGDKFEENFNNRFWLETDKWKKELLKVEELIKELREKGL